MLFPIRRRLPAARRNRIELVSGESLVTLPEDPLLTLFHEIWVQESYLPVDWNSRSAPTIVDIGAHVGVFTVWAARRLNARRILALEPSPRSVAQLRVNLDRNGIACATVLEVAIGAGTGEAMLYRRGSPAMSTLSSRDVYGSVFEAETTVQMLTLDQLFRRGNVSHCDLLKLDCEGAEYESLFAASADVLGRIDYIVGEYHEGMGDRRASDLLGFLESSGFDTTRFPPLDAEGGHFHASRRLPPRQE